MVKILKIYYGFAINVKEHIVMLFSMKNNYEFLKERYKMEIYPGIYRSEYKKLFKIKDKKKKCIVGIALVAGEKINVGDFVCIHENGKVYKNRGIKCMKYIQEYID